ncbi:MAG: hypothetical protein Q7S79_02380 [bacterium]|nr:hypothetical protein [bacterium]
MAKEIRQGIRVGDANMLAFVLADNCGSCRINSECNPHYMIENPRNTIRGELAGTGDCAIVNDSRWEGLVTLVVPANSTPKKSVAA